MTNVLKIPANSQAYLFATRDIAQDKFDVRRFAYDFVNTAAIGNALKLTKPGSGSVIQLTTGEEGLDFSGNHVFTIGMWWKFTGTGANGYWGTFNSEIEIWFDFNGTSMDVFSVTEDRYVDDYVTGYDKDVWHYLILENDGTDLRLYLNGSLKATDVGTTGIVGEVSPIMLWAEQTGYFWFDEVALWDVALSSGERAQLYNSGAGMKIPTTGFPQPWAYWKMEETTGTRTDSTGHGHHLTVNNSLGVSYDVGKL